MVTQGGLVIISGTPGTGKSYVANILVKKLGFKHIDWHKLIKKNKKISLGYNHKKQCYDLDIKELSKEIKRIITKDPDNLFIFDSHIAHLLPKRMIYLAIITKCSDLKKLKKRLEERNYSKSKVKENLECEIFEVCYDEVIEKGLEVIVFDSSERILQKDVVDKIKKKLNL